MSTIRITFVTSSEFKRTENDTFVAKCALPDGRQVGEVFEFEIRSVAMPEPLEADLEQLVRSEVAEAYARLRVPCVVEHAGLVFSGFDERSYPGGLTKPMWNTLGADFIRETQSAGREVCARAVVAYCDGKTVHTFTGETHGQLAEVPRGDVHQFYWDTVFIPHEDNPDRLTYSEIVEREGLSTKIVKHSQSSRAMLKFLNWRTTARPELWPDWD